MRDRSGAAEPRFILIVGPPRSGTTLLLNLLRGHPGVVHASASALGIRTGNPRSLETSVFDPANGLSDDTVVAALARLAEANPGKAIVEKTPGHLFHLQRVRQLLRPKVLCTVRDPLDIVASLLAVGKNPTTWWKKAPKTLDAAAILTRRYLVACAETLEAPDVMVVDYAELFLNTQPSLMSIQSRIGIPNDFLDMQVDFARNRQNVPFEGVWMSGEPGAGKRDLMPGDRARVMEVLGTALLNRFGTAVARLKK